MKFSFPCGSSSSKKQNHNPYHHFTVLLLLLKCYPLVLRVRFKQLLITSTHTFSGKLNHTYSQNPHLHIYKQSSCRHARTWTHISRLFPHHRPRCRRMQNTDNTKTLSVLEDKILGMAGLIFNPSHRLMEL